MTQGFERAALTSAPPARQATDRLAGKPGDPPASFDLPLTAYWRGQQDRVGWLAVAAALAAAAIFAAPFLAR